LTNIIESFRQATAIATPVRGHGAALAVDEASASVWLRLAWLGGAAMPISRPAEVVIEMMYRRRPRLDAAYQAGRPVGDTSSQAGSASTPP
jgi:hypothetical protein